ncbi:MAG: hypothetical protein ACTSWN_04155 [Promethearchaeota archaeon]
MKRTMLINFAQHHRGLFFLVVIEHSILAVLFAISPHGFNLNPFLRVVFENERVLFFTMVVFLAFGINSNLRCYHCFS